MHAARQQYVTVFLFANKAQVGKRVWDCTITELRRAYIQFVTTACVLAGFNFCPI